MRNNGRDNLTSDFCIVIKCIIFLMEHIFASVSLRERSEFKISLDAVMANIDRQRALELRVSINPINYHYRMAIDNGMSKREISVSVLRYTLRIKTVHWILL